MTSRRRQWLSTFADPAVLSDLFAAAKDAMSQVCDHDPAECGCDLNRATFMEWAEWVEREVHAERQRPTRFEPGHRPRRKPGEQLTLAVAG